jgi:hypothetical protein
VYVELQECHIFPLPSREAIKVVVAKSCTIYFCS